MGKTMSPYEVPTQRCDVCGRWIAWAEFDRGAIVTDFTPDTPFGPEETTHRHKSCDPKPKDLVQVAEWEHLGQYEGHVVGVDRHSHTVAVELVVGEESWVDDYPRRLFHGPKGTSPKSGDRVMMSAVEGKKEGDTELTVSWCWFDVFPCEAVRVDTESYIKDMEKILAQLDEREG